jgi:hypothetical protein
MFVRYLFRNSAGALSVKRAMKVIFCDIDGVLNCKSTPNPRKLPYVADPKLVERFRELLERSGAKAVLSSTWRYDPAGLFSAKYWGIPFIGTTPDLPKKPRCMEILAWLKEHPEVTRFAVIDDEDDELDTLPLFQPSPTTGLTQAIATGVADYLAGKTDEGMRRSSVVRMLQNVRASWKLHEG